MVKITFDLNEPKDGSKNDKAAQNGRTPKSLTLEIHHKGCFTPITSRLGLDYGLHPFNVDVDVLEMAKYVKDYNIILVYVEHGSSIFVTPKKNLTPKYHRNLTKEWEQVSSKSLSIGEVMKILSKKHPFSYVEAPIVAECVDDPFEDFDEILGDYANTENQITGNEIIGKQMVVHVGNSSTIDDVLDLKMLFETEGVGPVEKFKEVKVDADNESEKEIEDVRVSMKNFSFTTDPNHDLSICAVEVHEDDLDVSDYDSFGSDLDDGIDSERRIQLRELKRIGKLKNKGPNKYYLYLG
uniref:SIT4 phosphatase-associated protein family, armadillo-type fold protein n=1 Tax=Tanacetum cinerariifolium TaxID=118510 RepID=A0A699HHP1_TANCI|nr:SIT4 phosphatase-associated protein family, armadillo-type fold protein [Tanacetum cinerariifolium]